MRFYGRNRARMLGERVSVQEGGAIGRHARCGHCGRTRPAREFGNGRYATCDRCRAIDRERYRKAKEER